MQTELHRHLDVSFRTDTLLELAQARGLEPQSTSIQAFREKLILTQPMSNLRDVLAQFELFQKVLDRPEVLERLAFETVEDGWHEGTRKLELRYAPGFVSEKSGLPWEESLEAFERGIHRALEKYPEMRAGLICICVRDLGPEAVDQSVEFYLKHQDRFIGLDLAGNEDENPCAHFQASFRKAIARKANITIHAGEASGPDSVWAAIELLGAQRIGHGVASIRDPKLVQYLGEKKICLEVCPTSNWITRAVPSLAGHPLPQLLRAGVPVSISTDDPGIFGSSLPDEIGLCRRQMGMSDSEIVQCMEHASKASFIQ